MLRNLMIVSTAAGMSALIPTVNAASPLPEANRDPVCPPPMRASDLPIYDAPHAAYGEFEKEKAKVQRKDYVREKLLTPVRVVREQVQVVLEQTDSLKHKVEDHYHMLQDKSEWIFQYLREEENKQVRYGAVAMGGITGFIFGLRGGSIRRILYAGLGTTGMGLVCFPEDTKDIMKNNSILAKQYINIAYNFLYGAPLDEEMEDN